MNLTYINFAWVSMSGIDSSLPGDVAVYNMESEKLIKMIPVGIEPRYISIFSAGKKIYVPNSGSSTISVIDCDSFNVVTTIPVGKNPQTLVIDPIGYKGYVANLDEQSISIIDLHKNMVTEIVSLSFCSSDLALSRDGKRLYVVGAIDYSLSIIDTEQNQVLVTLPLSNYRNDHADISLGHALSYPGLALSPDDTYLYVVIPSEDRIALVNTILQQEVASIPAGQSPHRIILHPLQPLAYVTNPSSNSISVISTHEQRLLTTIPFVNNPSDLTLTPDGSLLWVTNDYQLTIIDTITNSIVSEIIAPPSAQIRQGLVYSKSERDFHPSEVSLYSIQRPYSFVLEKIYFKPPKPFDLTLQLQFPTPIARAEGIIFEDAEVKFPSISILPLSLRPNYYQVTFSFRIPYRVVYRDEQGHSREIKDAIHHVLSGIEIHLPPSRINQSLNLKVATRSEVIGKSAPTLNSLDLLIRTQLVAMQQIHITE